MSTLPCAPADTGVKAAPAASARIANLFIGHLPPPPKARAWRPNESTPEARRCKAALELPAGLQEPVANDAQHQVDGEEQGAAQQDRRVGDSKEAEAEAGDDVEEGIGVAHRLEGRGEVVDRIEGARQERER